MMMMMMILMMMMMMIVIMNMVMMMMMMMMARRRRRRGRRMKMSTEPLCMLSWLRVWFSTGIDLRLTMDLNFALLLSFGIELYLCKARWFASHCLIGAYWRQIKNKLYIYIYFLGVSLWSYWSIFHWIGPAVSIDKVLPQLRVLSDSKIQSFAPNS